MYDGPEFLGRRSRCLAVEDPECPAYRHTGGKEVGQLPGKCVDLTFGDTAYSGQKAFGAFVLDSLDGGRIEILAAELLDGRTSVIGYELIGYLLSG